MRERRVKTSSGHVYRADSGTPIARDNLQHITHGCLRWHKTWFKRDQSEAGTIAMIITFSCEMRQKELKYLPRTCWWLNKCWCYFSVSIKIPRKIWTHFPESHRPQTWPLVKSMVVLTGPLHQHMQTYTRCLNSHSAAVQQTILPWTSEIAAYS